MTRLHQEQFEVFCALVTAELNDVPREQAASLFGEVTADDLPVLIGVAIVWTAETVRMASGLTGLTPPEVWRRMLEIDQERRRAASENT